VVAIESSTGFRSRRARAKAALPQGCHSTPFESTLSKAMRIA
jgi:hypothetical protein